MATLAVGKIIAAEGAAVVMTGHAALRAGGGMVHERLGRADLSPLRQPRPDVVTVVATESLPRAVPGVAEINPEGLRRLGRPAVTPDLVTSAARGDVVPGTTLRARRVARVTGVVRAETSGDRERDAAARGFVAGDAARARSRRARRVPRVIETDVETSERGE